MEKEKKAKKAQERQKQKMRDYVSVFGSSAGKKVLDDLKRRCFYNTPTIDESSNKMAFKEGQRAVILHLETMMNMTEDRIEKLFNQQKGGK